METIERERERAALARRVGVLAAIDVAEAPRLQSRFGAKAEHAVTAVLDGLIARGGESPELHSPRSGGGFWILFPETGFYAAHQRLQQLCRQVSQTVVDVGGERLRVTPVIGYATFADATSARELCEHASDALHGALRNLDLVPVKYSRSLAIAGHQPASRDRPMRLIEKFWTPLLVGFILSVLLEVPFIAYVLSWHAGFDLTTVTYPLLAVALGGSAIAVWIASFRIASGSIESLGMVEPDAASPEPERGFPLATAIVVASLPSESITIVDTVTSLLEHDYPGEFQVVLAYDAPEDLPIQDSLDDLAERDPRLLCLRVEAGTSKAECVHAALPHVRGEFVGIFDADNHLEQGSFLRAWHRLCNGHDIVQGHRVVRNGEMSWVTRLVAVDYERTQAVSDQGRRALDGFGIFAGSNTYWRTAALRDTASKGSMPLKEIPSSNRGPLSDLSPSSNRSPSSDRRLQAALAFISDPALISTELAPTTLRALWRQRMRWARPRARSGWMQTIPWLALQVVPIVGFVVWDDRFGKLNHLIPLFGILAFFLVSVGVAQGAFAYLLANPRIKRHRWWFVTYAFHAALWFGEFKDLIVRLGRLKGAVAERRFVTTDTETVRPFLERASERTPDFTSSDHNSSREAYIFPRVDGVPLARELVAARAARAARAESTDESGIAAELDRRFSLLTDGTDSQILRAVIEWSYDLLSERERAVLCRLSVFAGGWNLAAAEAVAAEAVVVTHGTDVVVIADVLGSLVDMRFVQTDQTSFGLRYRMPETICEFAAEKLAERDDGGLEARSAHARFFLAFATNSARGLRGIPEPERFDRLEADHDNLLAAIGTFLDDPKTGSTALRIIMELSPFFKPRHDREWFELFTAALSVGAVYVAGERAIAGERATTTPAEALGFLGALTSGPKQRRYLEEALAIARTLGELATTAEILSLLSSCAFHDGDLEGCAKSAGEAVTIARIVGDQGLLGRALVRKAAAVSVEDLLEACDISREAIAALRMAGDRSREVAALANLATFEQYAGDLEASGLHYSEALLLAEEIGDTHAEKDILANMGGLAVRRDDLVGAAKLYSRALEGAAPEVQGRSCSYLLLGIALCITKMSYEQDAAATLCGAADAQIEQLGLSWEIWTNDEREEGQDALRRSMQAQAFATAYARGRGLTLEDAVTIAQDVVNKILLSPPIRLAGDRG